MFKSFIRNPYALITLVYVLAHFFLLILSGCWWDDWTFSTHNLDYIHAVASQSGRPEWDLLIPFCWSLPNNGRILIFFLYYLISLFVYNIFLKSDLFDEKESLILALVFSVVPVNDARLLISNFSYTVGLFFFYMSFMFFVRWNHMEKSLKKTIFRILLLISFYIGFILNSVLAFYYILIAYLFVLDFRKNKESNIIRRFFITVKNVLISYPDFFIWPFVYYGMNKLLFPTTGDVFGEYNAVTVDGAIKCLTFIPKSLVSLFLDILKKCLSCINIFTVIIILITVTAVYFLSEEDKDGEKRGLNDSIRFFVYGVFVLIMGLLPYVMVRGHRIDTMGVKGRDAVLLPFGVTIVMYSLFSLLKGRIKKTTVSLVVVLGIIAMNSLYIEWQKDYYYQLSMENLFNNRIIKENDTFFLIDLNESEIEAQRYYSLNTNSYNVFGDQTRFFVPKVSNLYILEDEETLKKAVATLEYSPMMKDYDPDDLYFDAILNYTNDLSWIETLQLKYLEMFNKEKFDSVIKSKGTLDIYVVDDDFTIELMKEYDEGKLNDDQDVLDLLLEYVN